MQKRDFCNTLEGIELDFKKFKEYRTVEKPPKYKENVEIEVSYFNIHIRLQKLSSAWEQVKQEYLAEVALENEAISAGVLARYERFRDLKSMSSQLQQERHLWEQQMDRGRPSWRGGIHYNRTL